MTTVHRYSTGRGRRAVAAFACVCALAAARPAPALAQGAATGDVFTGFSWLPAGGDDFPRQASAGIQAAVARHFTKVVSLVADVGAHFNTASDLGPNFPGIVAKTSVYELLAGPRFTVRGDRVDVFAHALGGWAVGRSSLAGFADSAFALAGGGGVDVRLSRRFAVRAQFDVLGSFVDILETNTRVGAGLVYRFGG